MGRIVKSDSAADIGIHCFERAGLGKAPFRCIGVVEKTFQATPDSPVLPGATCNYCGHSIMYCCTIKGQDGKVFEVGSDCVAKTDDTGLIRSYKQRPEVRAANRAKAQARDRRVIAEWNAIMADEANREVFASLTGFGWKADQTWLQYATNTWGRCGAAGRARYLKSAKWHLAKASQKEAA